MTYNDLLFTLCGLDLETLSTFGFSFRPKVPHIRFRQNVLRYFLPTFDFGRK